MFTSIYIYRVPREHIERVMAQVDSDNRIGAQYDKVATLLDVGRGVRRVRACGIMSYDTSYGKQPSPIPAGELCLFAVGGESAELANGKC